MKKVLGFIFITLISFVGYGQGELKFEEVSYDFGTINEGDQAVHVFKFKNIGNEPVILSNVRASCGCTTPYWPKNPIPPNGTGEIKASYNSKGRPGNFHKSITVTSNAKVASMVLRINGNTTPKPSEQYTEEQIKNSPHLNISKNDFNFGTIQLGQQVSKKIKIKNTGKSDLQIRNLRSSCNCTTYTLEESPLKSGEETILTIFYRPRAIGQRNELVHVYTNDISSTNKIKISLRANIVKNASNKSIINNDDKLTF